MSVIECNRVSKTYGGKKAVNQVTFTIEENVITGLIGRNGAGKTTLLKLLAGFIRPTDGEIRIFEETPFNSLKVSANSIYVDDQMTFSPYLNLKEILHAMKDFYPNWDMEIARKLMAHFSLDGKTYHSQLSKGMKSTFNVIVGLAARCPLTIMDEPVTGMDAAVRKDFYRMMLKDYLAHPRTMLLSSHLLTEMEDLIENILLMKDGGLCLHKSVDEIRQLVIEVSGPKEELEKWASAQDVLHMKSTTPHLALAAVRGDRLEGRIPETFAVREVAAEDACVYITGRGKGGIDDVYR
ncbi:ABC transporter ATP-binding protein [Rossellomorea marisflavi]|uniref:ABC transporter ATP-binding protein n=1 Tax=Rossellomorea marisflavi TaxID=189381 RepID=UPI00064E93E0|nr:ABC transporter ATP-binding protein [Rossellomorea marisflavi]KML07635.1 ABC transporter [Rossellomorea marisflavi]